MRSVVNRSIIVTDESILAMGQNPSRRAFFIQNTSETDKVYFTFAPNSTDKNEAAVIGATGVFIWDSAMAGELYLFCDSGKTARCVIFETSGLDMFEEQVIQLLGGKNVGTVHLANQCG